MRRKKFHIINKVVDRKKRFLKDFEYFVLFEKEENEFFRFDFASFEESKSTENLDMLVK